jgi:TPR repeat protein
MTNLGYLYVEGHGVQRSDHKARYWYEKAVAAGDRDAIPGLAELRSKSSPDH